MPERILVIEDEKGIRDNIRTLLEIENDILFRAFFIKKATLPPSGEYLIALVSKLSKIYLRSFSSNK